MAGYKVRTNCILSRDSRILHYVHESLRGSKMNMPCYAYFTRLRLKCDGARAETSFRLSAKRTSPFESAGASVQSITGSRGVRIGGCNAGYTMFRGSVKGTGYPLHSPVSPSLPPPCITVCHHVSTGFCMHCVIFNLLAPEFYI
jgi:hypothetical protein